MTLVVVLLLAGCAAGQSDSAKSVTTQEESTANGTEETTAHKEETTVQKRAGGHARPPDSTLSYGGQEVKGTLGSYCTATACFDAAAMPVSSKQGTLSVPSGSEMVFRYGYIPDHYIVIFEESVRDPAAVAKEHAQQNGLQLRHVYSIGIEGYAAVFPNERALQRVKNDPRVAYVEQDQVVSVPEQGSLDTVKADAFTLNKKGYQVSSSRRSLKVHGSGAERTIPAELPPGEYGVDVFVIESQGDANYTFHVMVE